MRKPSHARRQFLQRCALAASALALPTFALAGRARFTAHAIPSAHSLPYIVIVGADGNIWFTESGADRIGRLEVSSGAISEIVVPTVNSRPIGLVSDDHGNLWFSENSANKIGRLGRDGVVTEYSCPTPHAGPNGMHRHSDGTIWFAESNADQIAGISADGVITEYGRGISPGAHPLSLASRDGVLWFSEPDGNRLARFKNGISAELALPAGCQPRSTTVDAKGNLWFVATSAHALMRLDHGNRIQQFPIGDSSASPRAVTVDRAGHIWFTEDVSNKIGVMRDDGKLLAEYEVPPPMRGLRGLAVLADGRVFFAAYDSGHIGELAPTD